MIGDELQRKLRNKYNPEGSDLRNLQYRLLEMLKHLDSVCKSHGIKYWLSSGTCLGAVRHGGFIPWDDDLDIEMLRSDYEKLLNVFSEDEHYMVQTYKNELFYTEPFAKLRCKHSYYREGINGNDCLSKLYCQTGIFLDIFVLEKSPYVAAESCHFLLGSIRHLSYHLHNNKFNRIWFGAIKWLVFKYIDIIKYLFTEDKGKVLRHTCGTGCHENLRYYSDIFPLNSMSFEGFIFPVPNNTDSYLRNMFGDYNEIPTKIKTHTSYFITDLK